MSYDKWKATPPDDGSESYPPPTDDEQQAATWEYFYQRARRFEEALREILDIAEVRADITDSGTPNTAMQVLTIAQQALKPNA